MTPSPLAARHAALPMAALMEAQVPAHHGDPEAELDALAHGCGVIDLAPLPIVRLSGADTRRFANAQLSANIRDLPVGGMRHAVITDRKGRIEGMADALLLDERELLLVGEGSTAEWIIERLDSYIIMDPLELEDLSAERSVLSLQGPGAPSVLAGLGLPAPERDVAAVDGVVVVRNDRSGAGGFDLLVPADRVVSIWDAAIGAGARAVGLDALEAARVLRGIPRFPHDVGERSFIHELGLVARVAAFDKGCYIGQEVINRMETMGKVNRQLMGLELAQPVASGAEVLLGDQVVGTLSSVARAHGRAIGLGVLRTAAGPGASVRVRAGDVEADAIVRALPMGSLAQ